jgi:prepilin-type processing-associated H-X9-DG protein
MLGFIVAMSYVFIVSRDSMRRTSCAGNLKQIGLALYLYVQENRYSSTPDGERRRNKIDYPPIDDTTNNFIFDANFLFPEYLTDHMIAVCPADRRRNPKTNFRLISDHSTDGTTKGEVHADCFTDDSYIYLGWMIMSDKEAEAFFEAYDNLSVDDYHEDITVPEGWGTLRGDTIHRLSAGVDGFLITEDIHPREVLSAQVPIVWERPHTEASQFSHQPIGGNVLYLDGHVDYEGMGEGFPPMMSEAFAKMLDERPREPIPYCE